MLLLLLFGYSFCFPFFPLLTLLTAAGIFLERCSGGDYVIRKCTFQNQHVSFPSSINVIRKNESFICLFSAKWIVDIYIYRCLEGGAEEFLLKPLQLSDLDKLQPYFLKSLDNYSCEKESANSCIDSDNNDNVINNSNSNKNNNSISKRKAMSPEPHQERSRSKMKGLAVV